MLCIYNTRFIHFLWVFVSCFFASSLIQVSGQNCPQYSSTVSGGSTVCGNQNYIFQVNNTGCNGTISFNVVGNYGSSWANEITWNVTSQLTGQIVAQGNPGTNGGAINTTVGPLNPNAVGTIFTLNVFDSFGDGFNGTGGTISVQQGGTTMAGPITGNFGAQSNTIFGANVNISDATLSVNTPWGVVTQTAQNCNNFNLPITIQTTNYCTTTSISLPWTITCNTSGATLASGTQNLTVFPRIPTSASNLVSISWNAATCQWVTTGQNDCNLSHLGTVFNINPNPSSPPTNSCAGGTQNFAISYNGIGGGANCCQTGGPSVPITYSNTVNNPVAQNSTFGGINNSAYLVIPPSNSGGNATSMTLSISMTGYCFNQPGANNPATTSYWISIYHNNTLIYDQQSANPGPPNANVNLNLASIPGYNQNSTITIYIYPNTFNNNAGVNTTFLPNGNCGNLTDGRWTASSISATVNATYQQTAPTPANCTFNLPANFTCCTPVTVSNQNSTICSGGTTTSVTAWQNSVLAANPNCVVFSSVTPVAGSVLPNNTFPSGINNGSAPLNETVSAYAYCDANGSGTINTGDTYTLLSTYTLTVNPVPTAIPSPLSQTICSGSSATVSLVSSPAGASFNWTTTQSGVNGATGGTGNSINQTLVVTGPSNGTATYSIIPTLNNCPGPAILAEVTVTTQITPTFNPIGPLCQNSTPPALSATSTNGITGTWNSTTINTSTAGNTTNTFTPGVGQCATAASLTVTITPQITPAFNGIGPLCQNSPPPALQGTSTNGITGTWNPATINTSTVGNAQYTFTPDAGQCATTAPLTINITSQVTPTFNPIGPLCQNSTPPALPASSNNGFSGTWNPTIISTANAGSSSYAFTPGAGQCASGTSLNITVNPLPAVSAGGDAFICEGAGIQLNGSGSGSLQWSPTTGLNNATIATPTASPQLTTSYTLTATLNGCSSNDQVVVNVTIPAPLSAPNDTAICVGDCVTLPVSGGLYYSWSPSTGLDDNTSSNPTACPPATTTYTVTAYTVSSNSVANGNFESGNTGFSSSYSYSNDVQPESTYFITTDASLNHPSFVGTDHTTGNGNFMVVNGSSTANTTVWCQNINVQANTDYVFSTWVSSMVASNPAILQFSINGIPLGNTFTAPESVNIWEEFFATWNSGINTNATICIVNQNTATGGNDFGLDDILFSAVCQNTETITVTVNAPQDATINSAGPFCQNEPAVNLSAASPGGLWTGPGITNAATGSFNPATAGPGTHTISYSFAGSCGTSDTQTIIVYPTQVNSSIIATICEGESYSFGGQTFNTSGSFQVVFQNVLGCDSIANVNLTVIPASNPVIVPSSAQLCFTGHSFGFSATGVSPGAQYTWTFTNGSPGNSTVANPQGIVFPSAETYPVSLTVSENGCEAEATANVTVLANPQVAFSILPNLGCAPHAATFSNQSTPAAGTFLWNFGNGQSSTAISPVYTYTTPGIYAVTLTVTGANGCTGQLTQPAAVSVLPPPLPGFTVQPQQTDINNPTVSLISGADPDNDIFYILPDGNTIQGPNNQISFNQQGVYEIIQVVISPGGCSDTAYGQVVINGVSEIFVPNAFTPNDDFINSGFGVAGNGFTDFHLWIFNRWGELLFETRDADEKWQGVRNGKPLKSDVYIYKIEYADYKGRLQSLMGHVTLLR